MSKILIKLFKIILGTIICLSFANTEVAGGERTMEMQARLRRLRIPTETSIKPVLVQKIKIDLQGTEAWLVLDIRPEAEGDPMDYERMRIFQWDSKVKAFRRLFLKEGMSGTTIGKSRCLGKPLTKNKANDYYLKITSMPGNPQFLFSEWQYASSPGVVTIIGYQGGKFHVLFEGNYQIGWQDLDKDGTEELVTYDNWLPFPVDFTHLLLHEYAYEFDPVRDCYVANEKLTKGWLEIRRFEMEKYYTKDKYENGFERVLVYYFMLGKNREGFQFFDSETRNVRTLEQLHWTKERALRKREELVKMFPIH